MRQTLLASKIIKIFFTFLKSKVTAKELFGYE